MEAEGPQDSNPSEASGGTVAYKARSTRELQIALIGNPNTGKSTLFNALCGMRQRVGNYPGVTVERKSGTLRLNDTTHEVVDLPGTYSLAPQSLDEMVVVDALLGRGEESSPDVIVAIVDASNLQRNLYLLSQVLSLGLPTLVVLNMVDVAKKRGHAVDAERLSQQLGLPVIATQAHRRQGIDQVKAALVEMDLDATPSLDALSAHFPQEYHDEVDELVQKLVARRLPRFLVERLLLDIGGQVEDELLSDHPLDRRMLKEARERLEAAGQPVPAVEVTSRYQWVAAMLDGVVEHSTPSPSLGEKVDRVLTHKFFGTIILAFVMLVVFGSVFRLAEAPMEWIEGGFGWLGGLVEANMAEGALRSLITDGIIAGVGGVVVFLPQIFILFFFIAILEDCGYLSRAAYLMDKFMVGVGLSGKSFIPMLSSFACAIPGIMATRVIESPRDRLVTILVAPLMSCSARLPVYVLLTAAFIPAHSYLGGANYLAGHRLLFDVFARHHYGSLCRLDAEENDSAWRDARLCDGTAQLQAPFGSRGPLPRTRPRLGVCSTCWNNHLCRGDCCLGGHLLPPPGQHRCTAGSRTAANRDGIGHDRRRGRKRCHARSTARRN